MNKAIKITNQSIDKNNLDKYLRDKENIERHQKIETLLQILKNNPDITEDMIRPELKKYLGIVKREYKKEIIHNQTKHR